MTGKTALLCSPSLEGYGSDLQLLQSVVALREAAWAVVIAAPRRGPLVDELDGHGAHVELLDFPVLRRADASPAGFARLALAAIRAVPRMLSLIRRLRPDVLYVNTVTLPWWLLAGRLARVPVIGHVHEAEARDSRRLRQAMLLPMLLAQLVVVNSSATRAVVVDALPQLARRIRLVLNGIEAPRSEPGPAPADHIKRVVVVGRLSPRKAPEVALEATALLRAQGHDVVLELCGAPAEGMEWFQDQLRARAQLPDLRGAVLFSGYTKPVWPALARADVVFAPSLGESFGNAVVEAQLAGRPIVATALQGHLETIEHEQSGLLVPERDVEASAEAIARLLDNPEFSVSLARQGRESALRQFSVERYRAEILGIVEQLAR